jgi:hypothetical protein
MTQRNSVANSSVSLTLFINDGNRPVAKPLGVGPTGELIKQGDHQHIWSGSFSTIRISGIEEHASGIVGARRQSYMAIGYGVCPHAETGIIRTRDMIAEGNVPAGSYARVRENFEYPKGKPGIFFADCESTREDMRWWGPAQYDAAIVEACPWLAPIKRFYVPSGSSHLFDMRGHQPRLISLKNSYHMHFVVDDASRIPGIGAGMWKALIERGHGFVKWTKNGRPLVATMIDKAVWQPEREDYAFGATLPEFIQQLGNEPVWFGTEPVLTGTMKLAWLKLDKWMAGSNTIKAIKLAAAEEERKRRAAYRQEQLQGMLARGVPLVQAEQSVARLTSGTEGGSAFDETLPPEHPIETKYGTVTVADLFRDPDRWHTVECCDPVEPEYAPAGIAKIYMHGQYSFPMINSMAHGGVKYRLLAPLDLLFGPTPPVAPAGPSLAPQTTPYATGTGGQTPREIYEAAKADAKDGAKYMSPLFDVKPLVRLLALADPNALDLDGELEELKGWGGENGVGKRVIQAFYKQCSVDVKAVKRKEESEAAAAMIAQYAGDGSLDITPDIPFPVAFHRFLHRYVMYQEKGSGTCFADLTRIGQQNWIVELNKIQTQYANIVTSKDDKTVSLFDEYLRSKDPMRRTATHIKFDPRQPGGFQYTGGASGVINVYMPPVHPMSGGSTGIFHWYLEHLIPDPRERAWLLCWLACKMQQPHVVGHSLIMVADNGGLEVQGTGRGTFAAILECLFGKAHVAKKDMEDISGTRGNGWNDWLLGKLFIAVGEVLEGGDGYRERKALYNSLKSMCDPNETRKGIQKRGTTAYDDDVFATLFGATNHADALVIPHGDRRFVILSNGTVPMDVAHGGMRDQIQAWLNDPLNIGALYRELMAYDWRAVGLYDPHGWPMVTPAKTRMVQLSESGSGETVREFRAFVQQRGIEVVSLELIHRWVSVVNGTADMKVIKASFKTMVHPLPDDRCRLSSSMGRVRAMALTNVAGWSASSQEQIAAAHRYAEQHVDAYAEQHGTTLIPVPSYVPR